MNANKIYRTWEHTIPVNAPFRVSAKVWAGRDGSLKYKYINFRKPEQFKIWLRKNISQLYEVVSIAR